MDTISTTQQILITGSLLTLVWYLSTKRKRYNLPPGPQGWPILGYLPKLNYRTAHEEFRRLGTVYGGIFCIKLGLDTVIVINDYDTIKEVLTRDEFQDRPDHFVLKLFDPLGQLVTWSGKLWRTQRNFALRSLRTLGFGKTKFEGYIHEEIEYLVDKIDSLSNDGIEPIQIRELVAPSISNVILLMTTGLRFDFENEIRKNYDALFLSDNGEVGFHLFSVLTYFPILLKILMLIPTEFSRKMNHFYNASNHHLKSVIKERKLLISKMTNEQLREESENYVDVYLKHIFVLQKNRGEKNSENSEEINFYNDSNLRGSAFSFLAAGSTTTMDAVQFFCLLIALHQDVQDKMFQEINRTIGLNAYVTIGDRTNLPITESIIHEVFRISSMIPINLPHSASIDTSIKGFDVPKGTLIMANLFAVHFDPQYFPEPEQFRFDRFLSPDGSRFVKNEHLIAFGIGKRSCPGESMAMLEVLLYTVSMIQRYQIFPGEPNLTFDPIMNGFQRSPQHGFKLKFVPRKNV